MGWDANYINKWHRMMVTKYMLCRPRDYSCAQVRNRGLDILNQHSNKLISKNNNDLIL